MQIIKRGASYYLRMMFQGKRYLRSLDTLDKKEAENRGWMLSKKIKAGHWEDAEALKLHKEGAFIGEILDLYRRRCLDLRPSTVAANCRALALVIRGGRVLDPRSEVESERADVLTRDLVLKFQELRQTEAARDGQAQGRARTSANAFLRQARSLFAKQRLPYYDGLKLPDLTGFLETHYLQEKRFSQYRPIDPQEIERMKTEALALRDERPWLFLAWSLILRLGLRNSEILAARWSWIERDGERAYISIVTRPDFTPKGREGRVPFPSDLLSWMIEKRPEADPEAFLVPGTTPTERRRLIYRELSAWVKRFIPGRSKTSYELRKHAGSIIATRDKSLFAAQAFLRHQSPNTTAKYYASLLKPVDPIQANQV